MKKNKPYLDPELNISFLANEPKSIVHKKLYAGGITFE